MSYSEDPATPAAPFSGDGSIFDQPDVVLSLPTTTERVVDTQSGFLLVVRRMGERLALYCKRRVGTPPSSAILLTPDESLKLSKVLAASIVGLDDVSETNARLQTGGRRKLPFTQPLAKKTSLVQRFRRPGAVVLGLGVLGATFMLGMNISKTAPVPESAKNPGNETLSDTNLDKFARGFVAEMLDFNPATYKQSQIQAMSVMSPDLLEKYWKETNFPLSAGQLKTLPQGSNVVVEAIEQERTGLDTAQATISAQLVNAQTKVGSPVKIKLKLELNDDGAIKVIEQEDLSAVTP